MRVLSLTWVNNWDPLVELVVIWHCVKLTAQHLSEGRLLILTRFGVAGPVTLPFSSAILSSKFRSDGQQNILNQPHNKGLKKKKIGGPE